MSIPFFSNLIQFMQKISTKRRKTIIDRSNNIDKFKRTLFWLAELTKSSQLRQIRKKIMIKTKIV